MIGNLYEKRSWAETVCQLILVITKYILYAIIAIKVICLTIRYLDISNTLIPTVSWINFCRKNCIWKCHCDIFCMYRQL